MKKVLLFAALSVFAVMGATAKGKASKKQEAKQEQVAAYVSDNPAYIIYNSEGEQVSYAQMVAELAKVDMCLFGEIHNDPISHWLEKQTLKSLHQLKGDKLVVGAEMWEADNQLMLDELLSNTIDGQVYMESSKLWHNVRTDYMPLLQYAKRHNLHFVATNIPRRYARLIYKKGIEYLDSLSTDARRYLPPYPIHFNLDEAIYKQMASVFPSDEEWDKQQAEGKTGRTVMSSGRPSNLVKAQAIKDATMAHFILQNWEPGQYFYHFHGEMHSANHTSICYYLKYYNPEVTFRTISIIRQADPFKFTEKTNRADFNIVIPDDMAITYEASAF